MTLLTETPRTVPSPGVVGIAVFLVVLIGDLQFAVPYCTLVLRVEACLFVRTRLQLVAGDQKSIYLDVCSTKAV